MPISVAKLGPAAVDVHCDAATLRVRLVDGREVSVPMDCYPRLREESPDQRSRWRLIGHWESMHWHDIDEDISVGSSLGLPS